MLLGANDKPPFRVLNEDSDKPYLIVCEHAGNAVPESLDNLGLADEYLQEHYAVDIGTRALSEELAGRLGAATVIANYSRLVADLNRRAGHPAMFPTSGEGRPVPGNIGLSAQEKQQRIDEIYWPFHNRIAEWIDGRITQGIIPALITIHSYTPEFFGQKRPWDIAVLWVQDKRMPEPFMKFFKDKGYNVGDNQPYDARILQGGTMEIHGDSRRIPNLLVEYRNDLLLDEDSFKRFAEETAGALAMITADESLYSLYDGPETPYDPDAEERYMAQIVKTVSNN